MASRVLLWAPQVRWLTHERFCRQKSENDEEQEEEHENGTSLQGFEQTESCCKRQKCYSFEAARKGKGKRKVKNKVQGTRTEQRTKIPKDWLLRAQLKTETELWTLSPDCRTQTLNPSCFSTCAARGRRVYFILYTQFDSRSYSKQCEITTTYELFTSSPHIHDHQGCPTPPRALLPIL